MLFIPLCSSLPAEVFKAELEQKLLVMDEQAKFQSQMAVNWGLLYLKYLYSPIYNSLW